MQDHPRYRTYEVKSMDQLKVLSNNLRVKIINLFDDWVPRTNKLIADALQLPPSKVHYHVRELERVGLLRLVETRERSGVVEKFYLPIAMNIKIAWNDVQEHPEAKQLKKQVKDAAMDDFWESYRRAYERGKLVEGMGFAHLTEAEHSEMRNELRELFQRWQSRGHKREDTQPYRMLWTMFYNENNGE